MKNKISFSLFQKSRIPKNKAKKDLPVDVFFSPATDTSPVLQYVGLFLRTLVLFLGVFGITAFICGAAGLTASSYWQATVVSPWNIALLCLPVAFACGVASLGKIPAIITPAAYAGITVGVAAINSADPFGFILKSALRIYNFALYSVSSRGYYSFGNYMVNDGYDYTTASSAISDPHRFFGTFLLATLIGFILYFCIQKRTRLFPIVVLMTIVFAPILTYNISIGNSGFAFMIVFICAALGLKVYDYRYCGKAQKVLEKKKQKEEKKLLRKKRREDKRKERDTLIKEADRVFDKAIDADVPLKKARQARLAVFKNHKVSKKKARQAAKVNAKLSRKQAKKDKKETKKNLSILKKEFSKAQKGSAKESEISARIVAVKETLNKEKAEKKKEKTLLRKTRNEAARIYRKNSMVGGYTGAGVALIAFLAIWIPLSTVNEPFAIIKPINNKVQSTRAYVTAYLRGSDVDINDPYVYGAFTPAPRELSFEPLELNEYKVFTVDAQASTNVYMRGWTATYFDWKTNTWKSADYEGVHKYREKFGTDFTPDSIKTNFYKYVYPSTAIIDPDNTYKNFSKYGFTVQRVDVWRVRGSSLLITAPAHVNTDMGILEYTNLTGYPYRYQNYFEGTYSTFFNRYGRGFSTISFVTALNRTDSAQSIDASLLYYDICKNFLSDVDIDTISDEEIYDIITASEDRFFELGIEYQGTSIVDRFFNEMTREEQKALLNFFKTENEYYTDFVLETYVTPSENEVISTIAAEITANAVAKELEEGKDGVLSTHETALAVVDYFRGDEFYYTLTPNADLTNGKKTVIEAFLTDVKQGYCSHFASAATVLLQEMGIPARYAEGFIATDFEELGVNGNKFRSEVFGTDAHAWVEVYIEGMGWCQYEVTPGELCEEMYDPDSDTIPPEELIIPEEDNTPKPPMTSTDEEYTPPVNPVLPDSESLDDLQWFVRIIIIALCVGAFGTLVTFVIRFIRKRAVAAMEARYKVIDTAKNRDAYLSGETDKRELARTLNDWILEVYSTIGCEPRTGELPCEFAERMYEDYRDLSKVDVRDVVAAMQKEEFGHGLSYDEQNALAEYLEDIIASVYAGMSLWQKIITRYIKRKI